MQTKTLGTLIGVLVVVLLGAWIISTYHPAQLPSAGTNATTTATSTLGQTVSTPSITFSVPTDFGLATTPEQVLVKAYIPPCDTPFDYCLYYNGTAYKGTNFESAGLRIHRRTDLTSKSACLTSQPTGYTGLTASTTAHETYSVSVFQPLGNAGAGHYASGALYRLFFDSTCYEFETRIGETQFANYPAGTIKQFTDADRAAVLASLRAILDDITITSTHTKVVFPE
ncbi:MAG TPA: hypothetical protein VF829_02480 [Candidatus Paceibacterota bacterium]